MGVVVVRERWALLAKGQVCLRLQVVSLGLGREVPQGTGLYWKPWVAGQSPPLLSLHAPVECGPSQSRPHRCGVTAHAE